MVDAAPQTLPVTALGKPRSVGGIGWGDGNIALLFSALIVVLVAYLAIGRRDVQQASHPLDVGA